MFCEKCGAKIEDGSIFCEICGSRQTEPFCGGAAANHAGAGMNYAGYNKMPADKTGRNAAAGGTVQAAEMTGIIKTFLKDPTQGLKLCCRKEYSLYGAAFIGIKCLLIAIILSIFKDTAAGGGILLYWMYNEPNGIVFIKILFVMLVADACWLGLCAGLCRIIDKECDLKCMIAPVAISGFYMPFMVVLGLIIDIIFGYYGCFIVYFAGIIVTALLGYEAVKAVIKGKRSDYNMYGFFIAGFIISIIWIVMLYILEMSSSGYYY